MSTVKQGDRVRIKNDGDGASGTIGVVAEVYRSGRMRVNLPGGGFRALRADQIERVEK